MLEASDNIFDGVLGSILLGELGEVPPWAPKVDLDYPDAMGAEDEDFAVSLDYFLFINLIKWWE